MNAPTPGRAAYEAFQAARLPRGTIPTPWDHPANAPARPAWEAAAQAAVRAARFRLTHGGHQIVRFGSYAYVWTGDEPLQLGDVCLLPGNWLFPKPQEATVTGFGTDYDGALSHVTRLVRKADPVP